MKIEYKQKLNKIDSDIKKLDVEYDIKENVLHDMYGVSGIFDVFDDDNCMSDDEINYQDALETLTYWYQSSRNKLYAEYVALYLIATHIARRGRTLHGDTAIKKLKRHGTNGKRAIDAINFFDAPNDFLHMELKKQYKVKLLTERDARQLHIRINNLKEDIEYVKSEKMNGYNIKTAEKHLKKMIAEFNTFHKSIRDKVLENQNSCDHRPF